MTLKRERGSNKSNGLCKLSISEDMTIYAIEALKDAFDAEIDIYQRFELDLSQVEEIDSAGIQLLLALRRELMQKNKEFKLTAISAVSSKLLNDYNLMEIFNVGAEA